MQWLKRLTTESYIERVKKIHNNKYDYSLVEYKNPNHKIKIICPIHGEFLQPAITHQHGHGCQECSGTKRLTTEVCIQKAKEVHGDRYDYSLVDYRKPNSKTKIICKKHGVFNQTLSAHINQKQGCPECGGTLKLTTLKLTTEKFIKRAKVIHRDRYDYSLVDYKNNSTNVKIICKTHGMFKQTPSTHLKGMGCSKCSGLERLTNEEFTERANKKHNNKYNYSLVIYKNNHTKIKIICPIHGEFEQTPGAHLQRAGCPKCSNNKRLTTKEFIEKANIIHNNKYDYSLVEYKNSFKKIKIICLKHGVFEQLPTNHLSAKNGCPVCYSSKGEDKIREYLLENKIDFLQEYSFDGCINKLPLRFDFYIPSKNLCIEYDGIQHFKSVEYFGGVKVFKNLQQGDLIKNNYCLENKIDLTRISYLNFNKIETILSIRLFGK